jgi:bifunctional ADP-heptose synthase (sugar kinase/adenylyltransferase)
LVKGDDYTIENIVGAEFVMAHGGEVKTISLVKGYSTSSIIQKIKESY